MRELTVMMSKMPGMASPREIILIAGRRRPSWKISVASAESEPGDLPPEMKELPQASPGGMPSGDWVTALEHLADQRLKRGEIGIIDSLTHQFEAALIKTALAHTGGRRVEAAHLLGLGRNTLTRKIQELGIDGAREDDSV